MLVLSNLIYRETRPFGFAKAEDHLKIKINDNSHVDTVIPYLKSKDYVGVLGELADELSKVSHVPQNILFRGLSERVADGGCPALCGFALLSCRLAEVKIDRCFLAFGRSREGVRFETALDNKPVHLFFSFCSPLAEPEMHVRLLGHLSRCLKNGFFRNQLLKAESKAEIVALIESREKGFEYGKKLSLKKVRD
jgi:mannitol/fructose-specific phosphotransferase system IIA component (Ntr-type)